MHTITHYSMYLIYSVLLYSVCTTCTDNNSCSIYFVTKNRTHTPTSAHQTRRKGQLWAYYARSLYAAALCLFAASSRLSMAWPTSVMLGRPDHPTARGLLLPLIAALGILALTAASFSLFPRWLLGGENKESSVADASSSSARLGMYSVKESSVADPGLGLPSYSGLIDPHNGDNGTDPAQTTTGKCCTWNSQAWVCATMTLRRFFGIITFFL